MPALAALLLGGCAGGVPGTDTPGDGKAEVQVNVDFAPRQARLEAGESAQSVRLTFSGEYDDATVVFDRTDAGRPTVSLEPGVYTLQAVFTGLADGQGSTVATASGQVTVTGSGVLDESIAADGRVASIALAPDTSPNLYPVVSNLGLTVRDAENRILAVRGDAASLIAGTEGSLLPFGNGYTVLFEGDMTLRASTDGVQSNSVTVRSQKSVSSGGVVTPNYADEVQLARWERMPLTIRFDRSGAYRFDLETRFREAMNDWTSRTKNEVRFVETNSASADLAVSFVTQASLGGDTVGLTSFTYRDTSEGRIHTKATLKISSDYGNSGQIRAICAHELGHALGIEGHSQEQDLMYFRIGGIYNQRDVNTLRTAYREDFSLTRSIPSEGPEKQATISCPK